jgi:uncharacterized protein YraI
MGGISAASKCGRAAALVAAGLLIATLAAPASAAPARTTQSLNLRQDPSLGARIITTMPAGAAVDVSHCNGGWCQVAYSGYSGFASQTGLTQTVAGGPRVRVYQVPIDPPYPYRAGYYPTADTYFKYPPYAQEHSWFYPKRYLLSPREHDRYRYQPHIFTMGDAAAAYGQ